MIQTIKSSFNFPSRVLNIFHSKYFWLKDLERVLFFLTVLLLPTQLGKHFWPDYAHIYSIRVDYLSPIIYLWDVLVILLLVLWLKNRPYINSAGLGLLLLFLLSQVISLFAAMNIFAGLVKLEQIFIVAVYGLYISSQDFKFINKGIYWGLLMGVVLESILASLQFMAGGDMGLWILGERSFNLSTPSIATFNWLGQVFLRPYGTFGHPNVLAGYLLLGLILINGLPFKRGKVASNILAMMAIFLCFSRTVLVVGFLDFFFIFRKLWFIFLFALLLLSPFLFIRFESIFNFDYLTIARRADLADIALKYFINYPFFGIGLNNFINNNAFSDLVIGPNRFFQPVHNIYLLVLAESGILGGISYMFLWLTPLLKILRREKNRYFYHLGILWVTMFMLGMADHYLLTLPQGLRIFFLIWGLSMLEYKSGEFKENSSTN